MRHIQRALLNWILLLGLCSHIAFAANTDHTQTIITAHYQRMDKAAIRLDLNSYTAYASADIVAFDDGETFKGLKQFRKHLSEDFDATRKMYSFTSKLDRFALVDDVASSNLTTHMVCDTVDSEGKFGAKGEVHHFDLKMAFHNEWKQLSGKWVITRFDSVGFSGTVDGKPIPKPDQK